MPHLARSVFRIYFFSSSRESQCYMHLAPPFHQSIGPWTLSSKSLLHLSQRPTDDWPRTNGLKTCVAKSCTSPAQAQPLRNGKVLSMTTEQCTAHHSIRLLTSTISLSRLYWRILTRQYRVSVVLSLLTTEVAQMPDMGLLMHEFFTPETSTEHE